MGHNKHPPTGSVSPSELLSVGKVAKVTGISPDTLRIWERRYGCPVPYRLPSGHRRYSADQAQWLTLVAEALAQGLRPSKVLPLEPSELEELLLAHAPKEADAATRDYVQLLRGFESEELTRRLMARARDEQPLNFLEGCIAPLLTHVGTEWACDQIFLRHEHLCSQVVASVLHGARMDLLETAGKARKPCLIVSTLPGDNHELGLQMVAYLAESKGVSVKVLGCDVPCEEILAAVRECNAQAVGISVSATRGGIKADRLLAEMAADLDVGVELIAGGSGARSGRRSPRGVRLLATLGELERWLVGWVARASRRVS